MTMLMTSEAITDPIARADELLRNARAAEYLLEARWELGYLLSLAEELRAEWSDDLRRWDQWGAFTGNPNDAATPMRAKVKCLEAWIDAVGVTDSVLYLWVEDAFGWEEDVMGLPLLSEALMGDAT